MKTNATSQLTEIPVAAAKVILNLASKIGFQPESQLASPIPVESINPKGFQHVVLLTPEEAGSNPLLLLIRLPWSGIMLDPANGTAEPLDRKFRKEVITWLADGLPRPQGPEVTLNEALILVQLMNGIYRDPLAFGQELASGVKHCVIDEGTEEMLGVNLRGFIDRLEALPDSARESLWDSIENYWNLREVFATHADAIRHFFRIQGESAD